MQKYEGTLYYAIKMAIAESYAKVKALFAQQVLTPSAFSAQYDCLLTRHSFISSNGKPVVGNVQNLYRMQTL